MPKDSNVDFRMSIKNTPTTDEDAAAQDSNSSVPFSTGAYRMYCQNHPGWPLNPTSPQIGSRLQTYYDPDHNGDRDMVRFPRVEWSAIDCRSAQWALRHMTGKICTYRFDRLHFRPAKSNSGQDIVELAARAEPGGKNSIFRITAVAGSENTLFTYVYRCI